MARKRTKIKCKWCKRKFMPEHHLQKYCKPRCQLDSKQAKMRAKRKAKGSVNIGDTIDCAICNTPFANSHPREIYCCDDCRREAKRLKTKVKYNHLGDTDYCVICDSPFVVEKLRQRHCSDECKLTSVNRRTRMNPWRKLVLERDNYTCQDCGSTEWPLIAHHIKDYNNHPELRTVVSNGVTVCHSCHCKRHGWTQTTTKPRYGKRPDKAKALEDYMAPKGIEKTVVNGLKWIGRQLSIFDD